MLEILTVLFSSLAIIWARKTDIQQEIADEQSRRQLGNAFRHPKDKLDARLNHFHVRLLNVIGEGIHIPAFCLATSLAFSTAAFLVSLISGSPSIEALYLPYHSQFPQYHRLLFAGVILISTALFVIARYRSRPIAESVSNPPLTYSMSRRLKSLGTWGHLSGAILLAITVHYSYRNPILSVLTFLIAGGAAVTCNPTVPNRVLLEKAPIATSIGSALGVLGFIVATLSFTSQQLPETLWSFALVLAAIAAASALLGVWTSTITPDCEVFPSKNTRAFLVMSYIGRPAMFGGFYCSRAPGQFCIAVCLLILCCAALKMVATDPVVVACSIIMELCIFAAGATAISGAGALAFGAMVFITLYVLFWIGDPIIIFDKWSYMLVFWIFVPFINMSFDSIRWLVIMKTLKARSKSTYMTPAVYLGIDLLAMIVSLVCFSVLGANAIRWYNYIAGSSGIRTPIPIDQFIDDASQDFWRNGMWFAIMFFSLFIPTLINLCIFLSSGVLRIVPDFTRERIAAACERDSITRRDADLLAWKISAADSLTGVIFLMVGLALLIYVVVWLLPAIGEILLAMAKIKFV